LHRWQTNAPGSLSSESFLVPVTICSAEALLVPSFNDSDLKSRMSTAINAERRLTFRELQILELICEGYSNKQVARQLSISVKTVGAHRMSLMEKAGVHDPISLFRWALLNGYVTVGFSDDALLGPTH
jgi:DNA-binding NarL/FixJ family response regulator